MGFELVAAFPKKPDALLFECVASGVAECFGEVFVDGLGAAVEGGACGVLGEVADEQDEVADAVGLEAWAEIVVAKLSGVDAGTDGGDVEEDFEEKTEIPLFLR